MYQYGPPAYPPQDFVPPEIESILANKGWGYYMTLPSGERYYTKNSMYATWKEAVLYECLPLLMALES